MHWTWWQSGLALSGIALANWFATKRLLAVSGRFTALVNHARHGQASDAEGELGEAALIQAMRELTAEEFGEAAVAEVAPKTVELPEVRQPAATAEHLAFIAALAAGGLLASTMTGGVTPSFHLRSNLFGSIFGHAPWATAIVLLFGGALVGFGTRMAAGCTSGHGLCGVSRLQRGSLLATCAFFGAGILASFGLGALL